MFEVRSALAVEVGFDEFLPRAWQSRWFAGGCLAAAAESSTTSGLAGLLGCCAFGGVSRSTGAGYLYYVLAEWVKVSIDDAQSRRQEAPLEQTRRRRSRAQCESKCSEADGSATESRVLLEGRWGSDDHTGTQGQAMESSHALRGDVGGHG